MTDGPPQADAHTRILDAAEAIVHARGVPALTLEAAARGAGVSKGGLLYHFASKEALLTAMLGRLATAMAQDFDRAVATQPAGPGRATRALLAWAFDEPTTACAMQDRAAAVFLAAFHHDRALLDPVRAVFARMLAALAEDGLAPGASHVVLCVTDGLFMSHMFGTYTLDQNELDAMRAILMRLLEPAR